MAAIRTQNDLCNELGVAKSTVSKYLKRPDWPVKKRGPWTTVDVEKIRVWRVGLQDDRSEKAKTSVSRTSEGSPNYGEMKAKGTAIKALADGEQAVIKARLLKGQVVDHEVVERALNGLTAMFVRRLEALETSLPSQLGGEVSHVRRVLTSNFRRVREDLTAQKSIELRGVEAHSESLAKGQKTIPGSAH